MNRLLIISLLIFSFVSFRCGTGSHERVVDLSGTWQFAPDTANVGIQDGWYLTRLEDTVNLPGTTDTNRKGFVNKDTTTKHLNREFIYEGPAWYRKRVVIPEEFRDKHIRLFIERTKPSMVWVDSTYIGGSILLQTPQIFDLTDYLTPGMHYITIRIDNSLDLTPYGHAHIYAEDTQTNWHGMIGRIQLEARPGTFISNLRVYPDIHNRKIDIEMSVENRLEISQARIDLNVERSLNGESVKLEKLTLDAELDSVIHLEYYLGDDTMLWDEYRQAIYRLTATISYENVSDTETAVFGMRDFSTDGTQFKINGRTTFLRGKHDGALFPMTGHTPMDVESWERILKIAKSYGINHYRFHSYSPPEAAFIAADRVGIYFQVELPFWGGLDSDNVAEMLKEEGIAMLKHYGNHPSFVMFSHGNEIWSGHERVERNIAALKNYDDRPLYTMGSNNSIGYVGPGKDSDFFVAARTPYERDTVLTHTRLTHAFVDSKDGGILNTQTPSTEINFKYPVSRIDMPLITHEIGQYQIYPDYDEIMKYRGVLRPWNFKVFRNRLAGAGMLDQNIDFQKASGAWSALCYKAEMEAAIRTDGLGGFQLLDLQDFTGQGTALVGILDVFMESKDVISREAWLESCNDVVLLLEFQKYCWVNDEVFRADLRVANYSAGAIDDNLIWEIIDNKENVIGRGRFSDLQIANGGVQTIGEIEYNLSDISDAEKLMVVVYLENSGFSNRYPLWVYPKELVLPVAEDIIVADRLSDDIITALNNGGRVLFFPATEDVKGKSLPGLFPPEFWNYGMFKSISEQAGKPVSPGTLGLLTDPGHPVFNSFPTDFHTSWQWFSIVKAGNSFILDDTPHDYRPIVQVIDNLERNHKLGLIFEFKVGEGKLLVCMSRLDLIKHKPEARQLYHSLLEYMKSYDFSPEHEITVEEAGRWFRRE